MVLKKRWVVTVRNVAGTIMERRFYRFRWTAERACRLTNEDASSSALAQAAELVTGEPGKPPWHASVERWP